MRQGSSTWLNRGFLASSAVRRPWPELTRADQRHADTCCAMEEEQKQRVSLAVGNLPSPVGAQARATRHSNGEHGRVTRRTHL